MGFLFRLIAVGCFVSAMGGCIAPNATSVQEASDPENQWNSDNLTTHIVQFNSVEMEGRETGTRGFLRAATYVSSELEKVGLQPIQGKSYRHQYASRIMVLAPAVINLIGRDSLRLVQGDDYLVGHKDGVAEILYSPRVTDLVTNRGYLVRPNVVSTETVTTSTVHISGFIPGRLPVRRDSLILILAALDGQGRQGVSSYTDGSDLGVASAALLETVRRISRMQDTWSVLGPTILVSFVSGTLEDCQGPDSVLRSLQWKKSNVVRVIVLEDSKIASCEWDKMLLEQGISAPITILTASKAATDKDASMMFYPLVRREKLIPLIGIPYLVQDAAMLAQKSLELVMSH